MTSSSQDTVSITDSNDLSENENVVPNIRK